METSSHSKLNIYQDCQTEQDQILRREMLAGNY